MPLLQSPCARRGGSPGRPPAPRPGHDPNPARPLEHYNQVCFSAVEISWRALLGESLRLFPCAEGGTMVWQRAAVAIKRSSIPVTSKVAARSPVGAPGSITPWKLPCMSSARQSGLGWAGAEDECPAATQGASFATSQWRGCYDQSRVAGTPSRHMSGQSERLRGSSAMR